MGGLGDEIAWTLIKWGAIICGGICAAVALVGLGIYELVHHLKWI